MEYILSANEMKKCDRYTIEYFGIPSLVLMERAALSVADVLFKKRIDLTKVLVVCGSGNNGGDGFAIARLLKEKQIPVEIVFAGRESFMTAETKEQYKIAGRYGIPIGREIKESSYSVVIDALFGIGLNRNLSAEYESVVGQINALKENGACIVSVDIASGIAADSGKVMGAAVKADITVTFAFKKTGQLIYPGFIYTGELIKKEIGITEASLGGEIPLISALQKKDLIMKKRPAYSNKGTFGKVLLIAGSKAMAGAAVLAARACLKSGTGMVQVYTHENNRAVLIESLPEAIVTTYAADAELFKLETAIKWADIIGIGPGISLERQAEELLRVVLECSEKPLVIDADAITLLDDTKKQQLKEQADRPIIMTPHIGEFCRFTKMKKEAALTDVIGSARKAAQEYHLVCVCKDARTVIADPSGLCRINTNGNSGMASAGTGDALFGIICGLLAQGLLPFEAASFGVYLHGEAGDLAAAKCGEHGMLATDLIDSLREVLD